jgi:SHS2 domain-containing protein
VTFSWVEHTSELELHIEAASEELVFRDAMAALAELLGDEGGEPARHRLELADTDRAALLARWLDELVYLAETEGFIPEEAEIDLGATGISATVRGRTGSPSPLVKAVTYHQLRFEQNDGSWRAQVVLDV